MNQNEKLEKEISNYIRQYIELNGENIKNKINERIEKARKSEEKYMILHPMCIIKIDTSNVGETYKEIREDQMMSDYSLIIENKIQYMILNEILEEMNGIYTFNKVFIFKSFIVTWGRFDYFTQLLKFKILNAQY